MSSSSSGTPTTTSQTDLFPTPSTGFGSENSQSRGTNVYYLVFLGVLLILLGLASCLAYRSYRIRRRYRTATQLAIARGEPLPPPLRDEWGLGRFSSWTPEGMDRFGDPVTGANRGKGGARWVKVPVLWEAEGVSEKREAEEDDAWEGVQPLTVQSLLAPDIAPPLPNSEIQPDSSPRQRFHLNQLRLRRQSQPPPFPDNADPPHPTTVREMYRNISEGEAVRVAMVIQMPVASSDRRERGEEEERDEEVAWDDGMEIAVWEGVIGEEGTSEEGSEWSR